MAIGFSYNPPDYAGRAAAGLALDPSDPNPLVAPAAAPMAAAQAPQQGYNPSFLDKLGNVVQGALFDGQSPAEALMAARQRNYQAQTMQYMAAALQKAPPEQRLAMLLNPGKFGEEWAKNFAPIQTTGGDTETMYGGPGGGGSRFTAPKLIADDKSGTIGTQLPGSFTPTAQLGGDVSVSPTGAVVSGRTGLTGQRVSLPQIVAKGSNLDDFAPGLTGVGAGTTSGGQFPALPGQAATGAAPTPPAAIPAPSAAGLVVNGRLDPQAFFKAFTGPHEGGLNPRDLNGSPTNYGINQAANPTVDVSKLTPQGAADIFTNKYYAASGAANLPPALAAVHADTSFINPAKAQEFLAQSGGDPSKYMDLREGWMNNLEQRFPPAQQYAQAWNTRNADLRTLAGQLGGAQATQGSGGATGSAASGSSPQTGDVPSSIQTLVAGNAPRVLSPAETKAAGYAQGTVVQRAPDGTNTVSQEPKATQYAQAARTEYFKSPEYSDYVNSVNAANALEANLAKAKGNGSVIDQGVTDNLVRSMTGLSARQGSVNSMLDHLGLPDQLVGHIQRAIGNGYITPQVLTQMRDMIHAYADGHRQAAQDRLDNENSFANANGYSLGVTLPKVTPPANIPWLDGQGHVQGAQPQVALPSGIPPQGQRPVGFTTNSSRGPMKWTGTGWLPAN